VAFSVANFPKRKKVYRSDRFHSRIVSTRIAWPRFMSILRLHREETRKLPGERDNARNNARCTQARKTTHGLDGQHQDVDRTVRGRVNQNDRGQR